MSGLSGARRLATVALAVYATGAPPAAAEDRNLPVPATPVCNGTAVSQVLWVAPGGGAAAWSVMIQPGDRRDIASGRPLPAATRLTVLTHRDGKTYRSRATFVPGNRFEIVANRSARKYVVQPGSCARASGGAAQA